MVHHWFFDDIRKLLKAGLFVDNLVKTSSENLFAFSRNSLLLETFFTIISFQIIKFLMIICFGVISFCIMFNIYVGFFFLQNVPPILNVLGKLTDE